MCSTSEVVGVEFESGVWLLCGLECHTLFWQRERERWGDVYCPMSMRFIIFRSSLCFALDTPLVVYLPLCVCLCVCDYRFYPGRGRWLRNDERETSNAHSVVGSEVKPWARVVYNDVACTSKNFFYLENVEVGEMVMYEKLARNSWDIHFQYLYKSLNFIDFIGLMDPPKP